MKTMVSILMSGVVALSAAGAALVPNGGGGDAKLQKVLADPAPEGALDLTIETLANGLVNPWCVTFLPDGAILVTERPGSVRLIKDGVLVDDPIAGAPEVYASQQGGLFDILLDPAFAENSVVYISYAHGTRKKNVTRVARTTFDGASFGPLEVIFEAAPEKTAGFHFGGKLDWGPDGALFLTTGDGLGLKAKAQDVSTSLGAVVRINPDGTIPDDNPDFGPDASPGIYSKGHRNPQGLAYDAARGVMWSTEHGAQGGDELNVIEAGANYGWPVATYGVDYSGAVISPFTEYQGTVQPVKYWTPSIAPSGLAVYRGDVFAEWDGDVLVGALAGVALHRVIMDGDEPVGEERYLVGERVRDVRVGPDGAIYVTVEDYYGEPTGRLLRLTPKVE